MGFVYVGSRTTPERGGHGKGIGVYRVEENGTWTLLQIQEQINPTFLCLDHQGAFLYVIHGDQSQISAYAIEESGCLSWLNTVCTGGTNPVHLTIDSSNRWVFVANLQTGSIGVLPREEDGSLGQLRHLYFIAGNGGPGYISHPHQVQLAPSDDFLVVPCQGRLQGVGQVVVFQINHLSGALTQIQTQKARPNAEPRHCVFHPSGLHCYGVNEKDFTVTKYDAVVETGLLTARRIVQTMPEECASAGWASGIEIHPSGRHLYSSDRVKNIITCFQIGLDGNLVRVEAVDTQGKQPRFIGIDPTGAFLIAANELSHSIYAFPIDPDSKRLGTPILRAETGSPVCVVWSKN